MSESVFVYDDDCGFCTWWAEYFEKHADVQIVGFSELGSQLRDRLPDDYEKCSHLVTDATVYSCGASIEEALLRTDLGSIARPAIQFLRRFDTYRTVREWGYRRGANNRAFWGKLLSKISPARKTNGRRTNTE
ncbi:DCC1-like thiol-disulfide oxidoreductase family protein [Halopiger thermotolerans]